MGGGITLSDAFNSPLLKRVYGQRYEGRPTKPSVECLILKESLRVTNVIRSRQGLVGNLLDHNEEIRFLLPIRHPLACTTSNV